MYNMIIKDISCERPSSASPNYLVWAFIRGINLMISGIRTLLIITLKNIVPKEIMTKIEAQRKIPHENVNIDDYNIVHTLVEDIYKDFEDRTCSNCKHRYVVSYDCTECRNDDSLIEIIPDDYIDNFSCNKWEF